MLVVTIRDLIGLVGVGLLLLFFGFIALMTWLDERRK
jgi:hypothetical protein